MVSLIGPVLLYTAVIYFMARYLPQTEVKDAGIVFVIAVLIALLNVGLSFGMRYSIENLMTFFTITFFVRMILTVVALILLARLFKGFSLRGFWSAVLIGFAVTITGTIYDSLRQHDYPTADENRPYFQEGDGRSNNSQ